MKATTRPPPMTKARLGSHPPAEMAAMSRKSLIFCGSVMRATARPKPKIMPARSGGDEAGSGARHQTTCLAMKTVTMAVGHEGGDRDEGTRRKPCQPADAMPGGAAAADARPDTDEKPGGDQAEGREIDGRGRGRDLGEDQRADADAEPGADRQADQEDDAPEDVAAADREDRPGDGGNAGSPSVRCPEQRRGKADERAAERGAERREMIHVQASPQYFDRQIGHWSGSRQAPSRAASFIRTRGRCGASGFHSDAP